MFVFESTGVGLNVEFLGIAMPGVKGKAHDQALELKIFGEPPNQFQNYKAHLTMINIEPEGVSREWLAQLKDFNGDNKKYAPKEWINFIENSPDNLISLDVKNKETIDNAYNVTFLSEKQYLGKLRTSQGKFRENLLKISPTCKICGMNIPKLLVASHIKPWKDCNDYERINFYNGLLLCPSHDAAFDGGYITFDNAGNIIFSHLLDNKNKELLSLNDNMKIQLESKHLEYMEWHRDKVFKHK